MLVVISPAKRLDWTEIDGARMSQPEFLSEANDLARAARRLSKPKLQALMGISADLAKLNQERFAAFADAPEGGQTRPAMRAFAGDTYAGLEASSLDDEETLWAQDHLRILSGLYGVLRPLDAIQPYRLEMGSRLKIGRRGNLYEYWGEKPAHSLARAAATCGSELLVNCASQEYFGAVQPEALGLRIVTPVFLEDKPGGPKIISFFAKKARGAMARYIIQHRLTDPEGLKEFDKGGYCYQPELSKPDQPVFLRQEQADRAA